MTSMSIETALKQKAREEETTKQKKTTNKSELVQNILFDYYDKERKLLYRNNTTSMCFK